MLPTIYHITCSHIPEDNFSMYFDENTEEAQIAYFSRILSF